MLYNYEDLCVVKSIRGYYFVELIKHTLYNSREKLGPSK